MQDNLLLLNLLQLGLYGDLEVRLSVGPFSFRQYCDDPRLCPATGRRHLNNISVALLDS